MELSLNQSALILEESEDDGITVNVASENMAGLTGALCQALATINISRQRNFIGH